MDFFQGAFWFLISEFAALKTYKKQTEDMFSYIEIRNKFINKHIKMNLEWYRFYAKNDFKGEKVNIYMQTKTKT